MTLFADPDVRDLLIRPVRGLLPTRLILVNYWLYPVQVFHFVQGRLFLTGHNGSGKSTALTAAITMLLDGDSSPARLDPFGGTRRQLRYYLLGGPEAGFQVQGRRSYLALEFLTPEGTYETIGLGLSATEGNTSTGKWGFWLPGQVEVGGGLALVEDGQPLTERTLRERVGRFESESGEPQPGDFASGQTEYAALVRRRIYGASERDVQDTLDLLLTVRGSKLGREVRPAQIAELLRRSLPPVSSSVTGKLAEGIERLDRHAQRLTLLDTQTEAARRVAAANFHSLLTAARFAFGRQQAAQVRSEAAAAELDTAHADQLAQSAVLDAAQASDTELERELEGLRAQLEAVETQVGGQEDALGATERRLTEARTALEQHRSRLRREREREERTTLRRAGVEAARQADAQALAELVRSLAGRDWWAAGLAPRTSLLAAAETALKVFERDTERLSERQESAAQAGERAEDARRRLEERTAHLEAVLAASAAELTGRARELLAAPEIQALMVQAQLAWDGRALPEAALGAYRLSLETSTEISLAYAALREPGAELLAAAREAQSRARDRLRQLFAQADDLSERRAALSDQPEVPPALPAGREAALSALQAAGIGAQPLYRLVRPRDGVARLGHLEGALLASGVLTALFVAPAQYDKALRILRKAHLSDALLRPGFALAANLTALLEPEDDAPDGVQAVLQGLSGELEAGPAGSGLAGFTTSGDWINGDWVNGDWANGVLAGSAADLGVRYLGAAAREGERQRQLAALQAELETISGELATAQAELGEHSRTLTLLETELDDLQNAPELVQERRAAERERADAFQTLNLRAEAHEAALEALQEARLRAAGATDTLTLAFGPLNLEAAASRESLDAAQTDLRAAEAAWAQQTTLSERLDRAAAELVQLTELLSEHAQEEERLEAERRNLEATRDALQTTLSALRSQHDAPDAAKLRAQLSELRSKTRELERARAELIRRLTAAQERLRYVAERLPALIRASSEATSALEAAGIELGVARAAHPRLSADQAEEQTSEQPDLSIPASERDVQAAAYALREEYDRSRPLLEAPESYHPHFTPAGPRFYLQGEATTPDALLAHLASESEAARLLLTDEEARVFHDELIRELVEELDGKQREAQIWVGSIRKTLERLRFHDERLDLESRLLPPAGQVAEALSRLIDGKVDPSHQPESWWASVRGEVRGVVRQLQARSGNQAPGQDTELSFAQALERSLDYREWLSFAFMSVTPSGKREITDRTFAQRSGGERSAVLYTFLFAALGARFDLLGPRVPRLIGLDEAFAGMDLANIGALYSVMSDLELSWIATSERRIDLSPALSGAATYQLIRVATGKGSSVGSLCFVWDGKTAQEGRRYGLVE